MHQTKVSIEVHGDAIVAWCNPISDESFLLENTRLNDAELDRLQTFTAIRRRYEWLTTRWLLQQVFNETITISYHENGKPEINTNKGAMAISISHSKELIAIAINKTGKAIGVDCETIESRILKIKHKFANQQELAQITKNELENLSLVWSAKEALYKLYAKGGIDFNTHLEVNDFDFCREGGIFTGTISKDIIVQYNIQYKHIQNSLLVWVSE
jgi:phosphopantetheinyl transferase